ncbi:MAG: alpha/beta hydrolase [Gammaproteobacteria bacterium]|nr:alpha/beta hydrolase [Gammaproteobacteria bacterium]
MTGWTTGTCEANGINMHYIRTGGDKPPVVLLHGLMLNGACWTPLARALEKDYDVLMPDARGHGYSSAPDHGYCYDNLAADVVSLIDTLGLVTPVLLGHSMGGMTAAVVANRKPKRLRGLILADPTFLTPQRQREVHESDVANQHLRILNQPKKDYLAEIQVRHSHRSREVIELFAQARFQTSICAFEILTPPNPNYVQLINTLDAPSLLIIGDAGSVVSAEIATELAGLNQHLEIVQIAEAGHAVPYDQPERFAAVVQTFLRSVSKGVKS